MIRQGIFAVLALAQALTAANGEIPLSRLKADATLAIALTPGAGASEDAIWIPNRADGTVVRIDAKDNRMHPGVAVGSNPCASVVAAFTSVWVPSCGDRVITRISPADLKVTATAAAAVAVPEGRVAAGVGSIWVVTDRRGGLTRIDPDTNAAVAEIYVPRGAAAVVFAGDALWIASGDGKHVTRVKPHNNEIAETLEVGPSPTAIAAADGAVWTLNRGDGSVTRIDAATNKVVTTIAVGKDVSAGDIAAGEGSVWISAPGVPLVRIDPRTNKVAQRFSGEGGGAVLVAHGSLWLAAGPRLTWRLDPKLVAGMRP
jgi:virginiamycin B lyase